ncbi:hypothetical protein C4D60_Mb06t03970 [Musa balbisiana]|uniref:ZF-HD dimerization-type domain-containing protein n=1 Tax=Musa balbisiana TaxID=52838 RepID=A0A4S8IKM3_MUSBA|nr:hypothetical protein C4D60_Mb06t03970 [Musa balbisiana]
MDQATKVAEAEGKGKGFGFPNGALRKHHHRPPAPAEAEFLYRECLKNHAASLGGHALDGCGEFMLSPTADPADPTSLRCAACGCHRNFHRRLADPPSHRHRGHPRDEEEDERDGVEDEDEGEDEEEDEEEVGAKIDGRRDRPRPLRGSASPPAFFSSAPHMLLALSAGLPGSPGTIPVRPVAAPTAAAAPVGAPAAEAAQPRKRFRTKFSPEQKGRMQELSERLGWRMQKRDEGLVEECCREIGVDKGVFKVWMHNNKHTFLGLARRGDPASRSARSEGGIGGGDVSQPEGSGHANDLGRTIAMAKLVVLLTIALLAISMADSDYKVLAKEIEHSEGEYMLNAHLNAQGGAQRHNTTSHACSSARSVALSASVYPQVSMATKESVLATTTGKRREGAQNALDLKQTSFL